MAKAAESVPLVLPGDEDVSASLKLVTTIENATGLKFRITHNSDSLHARNVLKLLQAIITTLKQQGKQQTAETLEEVVHQSTLSGDFGGYGIDIEETLRPQQEADVVFLCSAYLEAQQSATRAQSKPAPLKSRPNGRRGMTMAEKIFAAHDVSRKGYVRPGDIIQVDVDWVLASELSWAVSLAIVR